MELYFLRHGQAAGVQEAGVDTDAQRPITQEGAGRCARAGMALRRMGVRLDVIAASPLKRARQTADVIGEAMGVRDRVLVTDALRPGCNLTSLADFVRTHRRVERVALIGHEPDMSALVGELTGGSHVRLAPGALVRVDADEIAPGSGRIELVLQPDTLDLLSTAEAAD